MTVGATLSSVPLDVSASNNSGAAQAGVPPGVSASNNYGVTVQCTS
jgi:hypothetical protein